MTSPSASLDIPDDALADLAVDFLDAMLSSADVSVIGVTHWWDRAKSALETGCAVGDGIRAVTARVAKKLQIETLSRDTSEQIAVIAGALTDRALFERWRYLAARDAVYVTAMVRLRRDERRAARPAPTSPKAASPKPAADTLPAF